jgi:rhodanese-related sulfurtransferase
MESEAPQTPELISVDDAWRLVEEGHDPVFIDTRNSKHYGQSDVKIPGSIRIWREELETRMDEVPRERIVITYCT